MKPIHLCVLTCPSTEEQYVYHNESLKELLDELSQEFEYRVHSKEEFQLLMQERNNDLDTEVHCIASFHEIHV